jgi:hypothetical protein
MKMKQSPSTFTTTQQQLPDRQTIPLFQLAVAAIPSPKRSPWLAHSTSVASHSLSWIAWSVSQRTRGAWVSKSVSSRAWPHHELSECSTLCSCFGLVLTCCAVAAEALGLLDTAQELQKAMRVAKTISKPAIRRTPKVRVPVGQLQQTVAALQLDQQVTITRMSVSPQERRTKTRHQPVRRSGRLNGSAAEFGGIDGDDCATVTYSDYEPGLKDLLAGGRHGLADVTVSICACLLLPAVTPGQSSVRWFKY